MGSIFLIQCIEYVASGDSSAITSVPEITLLSLANESPEGPELAKLYLKPVGEPEDVEGQQQ